MISIVIPCYNHEQYLEEAVLSVLKSSYEDLEIIIIDDGSTDGSRKIGEKLSREFHQISYYYQDNAGPSSARNNGISRAKGKYILPLDADDMISDNYIECAIQLLEHNTQLKVVYAEAIKFGAVNKKWKLKQYSLQNLALDNMIYVSAIYRKTDWERVKGYSESTDLVREDWEFWIKILKDGGDVIKLPFVGFYYRIHAGSRRKKMSKKMKNIEINYLNKHHADFFKKQLRGPLRQTRSLSKLINIFIP